MAARMGEDPFGASAPPTARPRGDARRAASRCCTGPRGVTVMRTRQICAPRTSFQSQVRTQICVLALMAKLADLPDPKRSMIVHPFGGGHCGPCHPSRSVAGEGKAEPFTLRPGVTIITSVRNAISEHPGQMHQIPSHDRGIAPGKVVVETNPAAIPVVIAK